MSSPSPISRSLPLERTHNGVSLANGGQALMVRGDAFIRISIGRAGFR